MGRPTPRRRDRIRAETSSEIKTIALKHLTAGGAEAVSLRAIARDMGMTASAIYSYFDTRDDLITALIADSYASLADVMEAAGAGGPDTDPADRVLAVATAYRQWAISHPEEFRLIYGDPVAGYQAPEDGAVREAEDRACAVLLRLVESGWPVPEHPAAEPYDWPDFGDAYARRVQELFPDLPPAAVALALRTWGRMHGQVALEIYGHLRSQLVDPAKLFRAEMLDLTRTLGADPVASR
ncbi:TetR/AcrR family transcriptional regulator [Actinosynnema sp. CA-299493]